MIRALLNYIREALACAKPNTDWTHLIAAIDAELAKPDQIPFGYWHAAKDPDECEFHLYADIGPSDCLMCEPLYKRPAQPERRPSADALDTPGNRNPEYRYAGYKGHALKAGATADQKLAYAEGERAQQERKPELAGLFVPARRNLLGRVTRWDQVDAGGEPLYLYPPAQQGRKPHTEAEVQEIMICIDKHLWAFYEPVVRSILEVPAP